MEPISLGLLLWYGWSKHYKKTHQPVPIVATPLGMREGNYAQAVPAVGSYRR